MIGRYIAPCCAMAGVAPSPSPDCSMEVIKIFMERSSLYLEIKQPGTHIMILLVNNILTVAASTLQYI